MHTAAENLDDDLFFIISIQSVVDFNMQKIYIAPNMKNICIFHITTLQTFTCLVCTVYKVEKS